MQPHSASAMPMHIQVMHSLEETTVSSLAVTVVAQQALAGLTATLGWQPSCQCYFPTCRKSSGRTQRPTSALVTHFPTTLLLLQQPWQYPLPDCRQTCPDIITT